MLIKDYVLIVNNFLGTGRCGNHPSTPEKN